MLRPWLHWIAPPHHRPHGGKESSQEPSSDLKHHPAFTGVISDLGALRFSIPNLTQQVPQGRKTLGLTCHLTKGTLCYGSRNDHFKVLFLDKSPEPGCQVASPVVRPVRAMPSPEWVSEEDITDIALVFNLATVLGQGREQDFVRWFVHVFKLQTGLGKDENI